VQSSRVVSGGGLLPLAVAPVRIRGAAVTAAAAVASDVSRAMTG
jgi:hypothetical protein